MTRYYNKFHEFELKWTQKQNNKNSLGDMNKGNKKPKFQHTCQVDREIYGDPSDKGFKCQFEGLYGHIREKHYDDFYDDFYKHEGKHYCVFHAPMEAKKALGNRMEMTKRKLLDAFCDRELVKEKKQYLNKFYNTIYGVINHQIKSFSERFKKDDCKPNNEEKINLYGVIFPGGLSLTKYGEQSYCEEHKNYIHCKDSFIPFLDFGKCEMNGTLEVESGPQKKMTNLFTKEVSQKIYPELFISGASFNNSIFKESIKITGVDFANRKSKRFIFHDVSFDKARLQCHFINFDNSIFESLSLKNSQISSFQASFQNILVHSSFDISCDDEADDNTKRIKSDSYGIIFFGAKFGDKDTYKKLRTHDGDDGDVGGKMICQNRIFDCDVSFFNCSFYQAPDFYNTKFNKNVDFEFSDFFQSCYKHRYYNLFRSLKFEMARKNLYREEARFWRYEEKCLEKTIVKTDWIRFFLYNAKSTLESFSKQKRLEKSDVFRTDQGFLEKWLSKLFDTACKRGTSFNGILSSIVIFPVLVFPTLYFCEAVISECVNNCQIVDYLEFLETSFKESFAKSMLYTFDPFHKTEEKITSASLELASSYFQSIAQITLYVIFGFMLRKRFRISS